MSTTGTSSSSPILGAGPALNGADSPRIDGLLKNEFVFEASNFPYKGSACFDCHYISLLDF